MKNLQISKIKNFIFCKKLTAGRKKEKSVDRISLTERD